MNVYYEKVKFAKTTQQTIVGKSTPVCYPGLIKEWRAVSKWSIEYFSEKFPTEVLRLEKYDPNSNLTYLEQTLINEYVECRFSELMECFERNRGSYALREYGDIFDNYPSLLDDLNMFRPFRVDKDSYRSLWIGPEQYVTGMHSDPGPTLVFQIYGEKRVLLYPPSEAGRLYRVDPIKVENGFDRSDLKQKPGKSELTALAEKTGWADVQPFAPDFVRYPRFSGTRGFECILRAGDALYIPDMWWHAVKSLGLTISVAAEPIVVRGT